MAATIKQEILELIEQMPDDVTLEDVIHELYLCSEIDAGLEDIRRGRNLTNEEVKERIREWLHSADR